MRIYNKQDRDGSVHRFRWWDTEQSLSCTVLPWLILQVLLLARMHLTMSGKA